MAKTEESFNSFLIDQLGLEEGKDFERQVDYEGVCPFTKRRKHKIDFKIISKKGHILFVEVKGQMTLYAVNTLRYSLSHNDVQDFYILQLTDEDWIEGCPENMVLKQKINQNIQLQFDEITKFVNDEITPEKMQELSIKRLDAYRELHEKDFDRWIGKEKAANMDHGTGS